MVCSVTRTWPDAELWIGQYNDKGRGDSVGAVLIVAAAGGLLVH